MGEKRSLLSIFSNRCVSSFSQVYNHGSQHLICFRTKRTILTSMITSFLQIAFAAVCCWVLFITIDMIWALPREGGVVGAKAIAAAVEKTGGDLRGGTMMGNIVSSPDASAGTLLAACGVYCFGIPGGLIATVLVYIGNRICYDPGYAGTTGCFLATFMVYLGTQIGIPAEFFIIGMVIAILTIQGISHRHSSSCLLYTSPSPRDRTRSRMPSSA